MKDITIVHVTAGMHNFCISALFGTQVLEVLKCTMHSNRCGHAMHNMMITLIYFQCVHRGCDVTCSMKLCYTNRLCRTHLRSANAVAFSSNRYVHIFHMDVKTVKFLSCIIHNYYYIDLIFF